MNQTEKPSVRDVLNYKEHIEPYPFVQIFAPTGSGKNRFVEEIAQEYNLATGIFTSRRTKAEQSLARYKDNSQYSRYLNYYSDEDLELQLYQQYGIELLKNNPHDKTITTYGMLKYYFDSGYDPDDELSKPENCYDFIVIDEIHSTILDSTYQLATFFIERLIFRIIDNFIHNKPMRCKHLVIMTATKSVVNDYFNKSGIAVTYDLMEECRSIYPKHVCFTDTARVKNIISNLISRGKKVVYFSNYVIFIQDFIANTNIPEEKSFSMFSNQDKIDLLKDTDPDIEDKMNEFHNHLVEHKTFLPGIYLLVTTSKYKEGIDFFDDIDAIFIESDCKCDLIQMSGRARCGLDKLYIVTDARQHGLNYKQESLLVELAYSMIDGVNDTLQTKTDEVEKREWIGIVEKQSPYIKYEPIEDKFFIFGCKNLANQITHQDHEDWKAGKYKEVAEQLFPYSKIHDINKDDSNLDANLQRKVTYLRNFLNNHYQLETHYEKQDIDSLKTYINKYWNSKQVNKVLKLYVGVECIRCGKKNSKYKFKKI